MTPINLIRIHVMAFIYLALADIDDDASESDMGLCMER